MATNFTASANFTRPTDTTAYAANDLIANSTTAGSVIPMTFTIPLGGNITRVRVSKSTSTATNFKVTLFLYGTLPTVTNGDNGAFASILADNLGTVAVDASVSLFSDSAAAAVTLTTPLYVSGTVYGLLRADAALTPANAEVFTVKLYGSN